MPQLTAKTYEATIFDRASQKLGLEQVVLGGDASNLAEQPMSVTRPRSADELQRLLRLGAYAVMMDKDGGGGGAGGGGSSTEDASNDFVVSDIDALLARASRRVVVAPDGVGFGTASAASRLTLGAGHGSELDVHADNFWDLVLPGYQSPRKLLGRLYDPAGPLQSLAKLHSASDNSIDREQKKKEGAVRRQCQGPRDAFVADVAALVDYLCDAKSDGTALDFETLHNYGNTELKDTIQLLTVMSTMETVFTDVRACARSCLGMFLGCLWFGVRLSFCALVAALASRRKRWTLTSGCTWWTATAREAHAKSAPRDPRALWGTTTATTACRTTLSSPGSPSGLRPHRSRPVAEVAGVAAAASAALSASLPSPWPPRRTGKGTWGSPSSVADGPRVVWTPRAAWDPRTRVCPICAPCVRCVPGYCRAYQYVRAFAPALAIAFAVLCWIYVAVAGWRRAAYLRRYASAMRQPPCRSPTPLPRHPTRTLAHRRPSTLTGFDM